MADAPDPEPATAGPPPAGADHGSSLAVVRQVRRAVLGARLRYTPVEISEAGGVDRELTRRLWRAMGFADVPDDEVAFSDEDLEALRRTSDLMARDGLEPADVLHLARVLGQASARMAESVVGFAIERVAEADPDRPAPASELLEELDDVVVYLLHRHLLDAVRRHLTERHGAEEGGTPLCVGFADLVGFTRLSQRLDERELAALVEGFEAAASDTVVVHGGRVVKMIGDEVMFAGEPAGGVRTALELAEAFDDPELPAVRVGLACGRVVTRAGDLFGPTVNLAARATALARPGSVLVSSDLFDVVEADDGLALRRLRPRRLKGIGWVDLGVVSRARRP